MDKYILPLLLFSISGAASAASLVNGTLGGSAYFSVSVPSEANGLIAWTYKNNPAAQLSPGSSTASCFAPFQRRCAVYRNGSLILNNITYDDEGEYTVNGYDADNTPLTTAIYVLRVYAPLTAPVLRTTVTKNTLTSGTNVILQCDAGNQKVTTYTFYRDQTPICSQPNVTCNGQFLNFTPISEKDSGSYTCTIQNPISTSTSNSLPLTVFAPLTAPILRTTVTKNTPTSGTNVTLQCDAGNQKVTTYTFHRDQTPICSQPNVICNGSFLNFTPITEKDSGSYTCTIQNPVSTSTSNSLPLTVFVPVSNVVVTSNVSGPVWPGIDSVSLRCSALGTNVSYSWSLQGRTISTGNRFHLSDNNSTLTISPFSTSDNGALICTATNLISSQNSSAVTLNLAAPVSAVTLTSNTSGTLWAGQDSVSLLCTARGSAITFSWRQNGFPVSSSPPYYITQSDSPPNSNLTISPVSKYDNGAFTCMASNRANNITSNGISLNINWFPDGIILCTAQSINQIVRLGCSWPGGKPAANVTMIFNNVQNTSTDQVSRDVPSSNIRGSNLTCNGDQLGRTSGCVVTFEAPPTRPNTTTPVPEGGAAIMTVNLTSGAQSRASSSSSQVLPAQFSWFGGAGNGPIQTGGKFDVTSTDYASTLKINSVSASESGTYYCIARNFIGNTPYFFNVTVTKNLVGSGRGLDGGAIAGIVIGVLAGVTIIGVIIYFVLKKKKRSSDNGRINGPEEQIGTVQYAEVMKRNTNGGMAETTISNYPKLEDKDDVKYASIQFPNSSSTKTTAPAKPEETVYSDVKSTSKR